jgi:beta-galactosidase/beta-glucuronidase
MQILNGQWWLATDAGNVGKAESWFSGEPASDAQPANVPGAIQQCFPGYHGVAWYWHRFVPALAPDATQRAQLHFEGDVRYLAEAWLNGQFLGGYEGGESPFDLDATGIVRAGQENRLVVRVLCPGSEPIDG